MFSSSALVFVGNALVVAAMAQETALRPPKSNIRVNSDLVLINASITDSHGTPVTDIAPSRFHLFEDGIEQTIRYCVSEDSPVSIGLVLDTSASMGDKLAGVKKAAMQFVRAANPWDEFFLLIFRDRPEIVVPFTSDTQRLISEIESAEAGGSTALLDAFYLAFQQTRRGQNSRKAMLVVSDGIDNHSRYSKKEVKGLAREVEFPIYTINMWQPDRSGNRYAIQRRDPGLLEELAAPTGGRSFAARDQKKLIAIGERIGSEIRHEYVLGYVPSNREADGKFRHVSVTIRPNANSRLKISHRRGYVAPAQ